jgi:predicted ArsR family transcriptional regulator
MSNWTFITNHGAVLALISEHKRITALEIADKLGITERTVRRVVADLVAEGYIEPKREKGVNRYQLHAALPMRRPEQKDLKVEHLLKCLSVGKRKRLKPGFSQN